MAKLQKTDTSSILSHWYGYNMKIVFQSILIGLFSGFIVVAYRLSINKADMIREQAYSFLKNSSWFLILGWFILLVAVGFILSVIIKKAPMSKGSGIPQIKGVLLRQVQLSWLKDILAKFFGGLLALGFGLSLGREGPSVQLGASTGLGFSKVTKRPSLEEKYLITAGASAGLAAAFNSPLAGVMFALEELHRHFSPLLLMSAMAASVTADVVSRYFFGLEPIFNFKDMDVLPLSNYAYIILLGVIIGVLGKIFNVLIMFVQKNYSENNKIKDGLKPAIPLILSGIFGFYLPQVLGGGHHLIEELTNEEFLLTAVLILFIAKLLFTVLSYGSGVPGGIFLPLLVLGALAGKGFAVVLYQLDLISSNHIVNFITLAMAAYFTAVVKAPITGSILITEMTGTFNHFLSLTTICLTAYVVSDLIKSQAIYDMLLENLLHGKKGNWLKEIGRNKIILEIPIAFGSEIEHKRIKDIHWPDNSLIVGIRRGEKELIPDGAFKVYAGDCLIVLTDENHASEIKQLLIEKADESMEYISKNILNKPN